MEQSYRFFQNKACYAFPCHKTDNVDEFNCLFCFCPLYMMEENCGGNYKISSGGVKDCSDCLLPHRPKGYDFINEKLTDYTVAKAIERLEKKGTENE